MSTPQVQKENTAKKIIIPLLALIILLVMVAWLAGAFNKKVSPGFEAPSPTLVNSISYVVKSSTEAIFEGVAASITAKQTTIISSRLLARIDKINVRAGDIVKRGDVLITLENNDLSSRVIEAQEQVNAMIARYTEAHQNFQRAKELFNKKIASQFDLDKSKADYQSIKAELTAAKQSLAQAQTTLSYATLRAPINGKVVDRFAEPGNTAQAGEKLLSLYNPLSLRVEAQVREQLALTLTQGQSIKVELPTIKQNIVGLVEEIVPAANTGSRSFLIKVSLPYQENLLPGMYARLLIPAGQAQKLYLPKNSVFHVGQLNFVHVLIDGQSQKRFVRIDTKVKPGFISIISGLVDGDIIVTTD
ncbi:efflux RND transporter periplasmic adaptor subunit [Colwellia psychrerythraea]|uniref:Efflux transporter, RND family, MFP subunit, AcrA/E family n=1 Tax=Colwellia psychrerythraea (strain 34H / ATCC BAA-681) TaxID=167879 RepID=Q486N8_COLP3|nr:efflux RND transporter periplasmic adaptor subunit [Colwellia psychrerythraea]AAZ25906.1 efflux transporter, RND family, MFP subunit, AcrA/E family [Colwellia psychrerythraea 34H]